MDTPSFLLIIFPISYILLPDVSPVHSPHSALDIFLPLSFEIVAWRIVIHLSVSVFHIVFEIPLKYTSALEYDFSFALFFTIDPVTFVSCLIDCIFPNSVSESVLDFPLITAAVGPVVVTFASDTIISELSRVCDTIDPCKFTLSAEETVKKVTLVGVAVFEGYFSGSVETFTVYFAVLGGGGDLTLPWLVEDFCEFDGEHHFVAHCFIFMLSYKKCQII